MLFLLLACVLCLSIKEAWLQKQNEKIDQQIVFSRQSKSDDSCTTDSKRFGNCIALYQCRNLIEQRNVSLLRRSLCGSEGHAPKVCCPLLDKEHAVSSKGLNSGLENTTLPYLLDIDYNVTSSTPDTYVNITQSGRRRHNPFPNECGVTHVAFRRIVGGQESVIGAWPWMAIIYYVKRSGMTPECGGVLVTTKHVLTAAHCIVSSRRGRIMRPSQLNVRLGDHDLESTDDGANHVDVSVESIIKFNAFDLRTFQNDIAILVLKSTVPFTEHIGPICIPFDVFKGDLSQKNAFVAGWGTLSYGGPSSSKLQEVQVRVWENLKCKDIFRREVPITVANLCAGDGDKDACRGDSGGPLMLAHPNGRFYLVGLVSFGKKCAEPNVPGVYTRITHFLDWIEKNIENTI